MRPVCYMDIFQLSDSVFQHIDWLKTGNRPLVPDWLMDLKIDQLAASKLSPSSYLCFCYGFLAMVAIEDLIDQKYNCFILSGLLLEVLDLNKRLRLFHKM